MTNHQAIRHYLDQRQLCLAEVKIKEAIASLGEFMAYTQHAEGSLDDFAASVTDDIQQAIAGLSEILEKLEPENEKQRRLGIARLAEVKPLSIKAFEIFLNVLPAEIAIAKNTPLRADEKHQADVLRYQQAGLTKSEAERLLEPPMSDIERGEWQAKAQALQAEQSAIGCWMHDSPRFNPELLAGTRLEGMAP